jgi:hypothetical protein
MFQADRDVASRAVTTTSVLAGDLLSLAAGRAGNFRSTPGRFITDIVIAQMWWIRIPGSLFYLITDRHFENYGP